MASEPQTPTTNGLFGTDDPALPSSSPLSAASEPPSKKHRNSGRKRDPVWESTTVCADKRVLCNHCGTLIHRYGVAKVERVRAHFERKCPGVHTQTTQTQESKYKVQSNYGSKSGVFKRKFAYWLYATGQPFEDAGNELLLNALRVLRSDTTLPTTHELENELLDLEFVASKSKVTKALSGKKCCLMVERWVDAGGCGVNTYGAFSEGVPYFLESSLTLPQGNGGEVTADEVESVLAKEKKMELYGIVAPTTAALPKHALDRIEKKHPRCRFFHGCVSNALSLLLKDVNSIFPWLKKVEDSVSNLIEVFHGNDKLQTLVSARESNKTAEFPDSSSLCSSLEDLLKHEKVLYTVVALRGFADTGALSKQEKLKSVQDFVLGETFVQDLVNAVAILRPLQQQLTHFQEDQPPLSQVFPCFVELLTVFSSMEWVSKKEKALITSCITERFNAIYGDSHGVAYTLDPLHLGEALDDAKKQGVENSIVRFCELEGHNVDILLQLQTYKAMVNELKDTSPEYWQLIQSGAMSPRDFWMERRSQFPYLHQLADAVFGLPASASASPSFGAQSLTVHSRFNRKLAPVQLQKLTHVYCNSNPGKQPLHV
eukprot:jgi/Phyca11/540145/estExt2_Genewise1Plus.C_PHYCAscaffold_40551